MSDLRELVARATAGPEKPNGWHYIKADAVLSAIGERHAIVERMGEDVVNRAAANIRNAMLDEVEKMANGIYDEAPTGSYDNGATTDGWQMACREFVKRLRALKSGGQHG